MSKLRLSITMSLDGYVAGPDQFVTDGVRSALERAAAAAQGNDIWLAGGPLWSTGTWPRAWWTGPLNRSRDPRRRRPAVRGA